MTLRAIDRGLQAVSWTAAALVLVLLFAGPSLIGAKKSGTLGYGSPHGASSPPSGAQVFASAGCGSCHTLKAAGATGQVGPNLDQIHPSASTVSAIVQSGRGAMPAFAGKLSTAQIAAVAQYIAPAAAH